MAILLRQGQGDVECAALAYPALDPNLPLVL